MFFFVGACNADGVRRDAPVDAVGIVLQAGEGVPAIQMAVVVQPSLDPDRYVQPLADAVNRALPTCADSTGAGDELGAGVDLALRFRQGRMQADSEMAPVGELAGCLTRSLDGAAIDVPDPGERRIAIQMRRATRSAESPQVVMASSSSGTPTPVFADTHTMGIRLPSAIAWTRSRESSSSLGAFPSR